MCPVSPDERDAQAPGSRPAPESEPRAGPRDGAESPPRILVADDHPVLRAGLLAVLESRGFTVVGEAESAEGAVEAALIEAPDVAILDLRMPEKGGLWALGRLRHEAEAVRVLVFTAVDGDEVIRQALTAGARGYLLKTASAEALVGAVRAVHAGLRWIPESVASRVAESLARPDLSRRELEVLRLLVEGHTNREIGQVLAITEGTVKLHVSRILGKLSARDRTEAATMALRRGIVREWGAAGR